MRQPHEEFENSRSKCEKAAPNPADYLGEIPLDYRARQHHSDRGCQYASKEFRSLLSAHQAGASMSRKGNCYDNAVMESFWATLKTECFGSRIPETRE
jgi:transposase InsO family protein